MAISDEEAYITDCSTALPPAVKGGQRNKHLKAGVVIEVAPGVALNRGATEAALCVWLVDDSADCCEHLALLLNAETRVHCPRSFSSAASLLAGLRQEPPPNAILLDVHMPVMNGIEAIRPIKQLAPATPVLMLTTFFDHGLRTQALAEGAADFLLKRSSPAEIVSAIRAASGSI
jgi:DNA-binding NarL/FixJ family response regulator